MIFVVFINRSIKNKYEPVASRKNLFQMIYVASRKNLFQMPTSVPLQGGIGEDGFTRCPTNDFLVVSQFEFCRFYFPAFLRLSSLQSIWQFSAVVFPPSCHGVI